jgi:hypothetical protein
LFCYWLDENARASNHAAGGLSGKDPRTESGEPLSMEKTKTEASESVRAAKMKEQALLGGCFLHRPNSPGAILIAGPHD